MSSEVRVLRLAAVSEKTGLRKSQIYLLESKGLFPARVKLTGRATAWIFAEVEAWLLDRIQASRHPESSQ